MGKIKREPPQLRAETIAASEHPQSISYKSGGAIFNKAYVDMIEDEVQEVSQRAAVDGIERLKTQLALAYFDDTEFIASLESETAKLLAKLTKGKG